MKRLDLPWVEARRIHRERAISDAELACLFVAQRSRQASGARWLQGDVKNAVKHASPLLNLFAERRIHRVPEAVARGLIEWGDGKRDVELRFDIPTPMHVLALQSRGRRCVSLLDETVPTAPHADALAFALHDLCHLEKFVEAEHYFAQVGFFDVVYGAVQTNAWGEWERRFDEDWRDDFAHVVADMNGSAIFLFAALKMKLKMATRRMRARRDGTELRVDGPLDATELRDFDFELEALFDALALRGGLRDAARAVSTKRDAQEEASILLQGWSSRGRAIMSSPLPRGAESLAFQEASTPTTP